MKKIYTIFTLLVLVTIAPNANAQGFLRGLREAAEKELNKVTESVFGTSNNSSNSSQQPVYNQLPQPSTSTDPRALLNELPQFPTATQVVERSGQLEFDNKISSVTMRIDDIKETIEPTAEDEERAQINMINSIMGGSGIMGARAESMAQMQGQMNAMSNEMALLGSMMQNETNLNAMTAAGDKMEAIEAEMEKLEKKKNRTAAEQKRYEELQQELQEISMQSMSMFFGGGNDAANANALSAMMAYSESAQATSAIASQNTANIYANAMNGGNPMEGMAKSEFDKNATALLTKIKNYEDMVKGNTLDVADQQSTANSTTIQNLYKQIWAETNPATVKSLYQQVDGLVTNHFGAAAMANLSKLKTTFEEVKALLPEAEKLAATTIPVESILTSDATRLAPYRVVEVCASILSRSYAGMNDVDVMSVKKEPIKVSLQPGDRLLVAESSYFFMMNKANLGSFLDKPKPNDSIVEDFLSQCVFLVHNTNDNSYYKVQGSSRTKLAPGSHSFYVAPKDCPKAEISMNSLDKKIKFDGTMLTLPDGSTFYPVAIQRTNEWLLFITTDYSGGFTKCMYKL